MDAIGPGDLVGIKSYETGEVALWVRMPPPRIIPEIDPLGVVINWPAGTLGMTATAVARWAVWYRMPTIRKRWRRKGLWERG